MVLERTDMSKQQTHNQKDKKAQQAKWWTHNIRARTATASHKTDDPKQQGRAKGREMMRRMNKK